MRGGPLLTVSPVPRPVRSPPTGTVQLIHGDARHLTELANESVQLVVTSPPYPMIPQWDALFAALGAREYPAMLQVLESAWAECHRVLIEGGLLAVVIGDALRSGEEGFRLWPNHAETLVAASRVGFRPLPYILWKKPTNKPNAFLGSGFLPPNAYVTLDCEFILLFRKGGLRRFPVRDPLRESSRLTRAERDHWFSQVWDDIRGTPQRRTGGRTGAFPPRSPRGSSGCSRSKGTRCSTRSPGPARRCGRPPGWRGTRSAWSDDATVYRSLVREAERRRRES